MSEIFVHSHGLNDSDGVGAGTRIWAFAHVAKGARVGADCNICQGVFVEGGALIGDRVTLKNNVCVWDGICIEDDVFLGPNCTLTNRKYPRSRQGEGAQLPKAPWDKTLIRRGAAVGAGATLICPVTIGVEAVVGAGSVVTRDVPDGAVVVGNPARQVGWACACGGVRKMDETLCPACGRDAA